MIVHFVRSGVRRYGIRIERPENVSLYMDPAPGFDAQLPHDMVHFIVEALLGLKNGVFGQIAAGGNAGSFHVGSLEGGSARSHRRMSRKQVAKGQGLMERQGREGELSELAAFILDVEWRGAQRADSAAQRIALAEVDRARQSLSANERGKLDAVRAEVFAAFTELSQQWGNLAVGEALRLEWPTLRRLPADQMPG